MRTTRTPLVQRKLSLGRETLRSLTPGALREVRGASTPCDTDLNLSCTCGTQSQACGNGPSADCSIGGASRGCSVGCE